MTILATNSDLTIGTSFSFKIVRFSSSEHTKEEELYNSFSHKVERRHLPQSRRRRPQGFRDALACSNRWERKFEDNKGRDAEHLMTKVKWWRMSAGKTVLGARLQGLFWHGEGHLEGPSKCVFKSFPRVSGKCDITFTISLRTPVPIRDLEPHRECQQKHEWQSSKQMSF